MKINLNELAKEVCEREGGKLQVNIAQVKEIIRCAMDALAEGWVQARTPQPKKRKAKRWARFFIQAKRLKLGAARFSESWASEHSSLWESAG